MRRLTALRRARFRPPNGNVVYVAIVVAAPQVPRRPPRRHHCVDGARPQSGRIRRQLRSAASRGVERLDVRGYRLPLLPLPRRRLDDALDGRTRGTRRGPPCAGEACAATVAAALCLRRAHRPADLPSARLSVFRIPGPSPDHGRSGEDRRLLPHGVLRVPLGLERWPWFCPITASGLPPSKPGEAQRPAFAASLLRHKSDDSVVRASGMSESLPCAGAAPRPG